MIYRAAAAYPYVDVKQATAALREQLRLMALAGGGTPDWSTLVLDGPSVSAAQYGEAFFEWTATLSVDGGRDLTRDFGDDDLIAPAPTAGLVDFTVPQSLIS